MTDAKDIETQLTCKPRSKFLTVLVCLIGFCIIVTLFWMRKESTSTDIIPTVLNSKSYNDMSPSEKAETISDLLNGYVSYQILHLQWGEEFWEKRPNAYDEYNHWTGGVVQVEGKEGASYLPTEYERLGTFIDTLEEYQLGAKELSKLAQSPITYRKNWPIIQSLGNTFLFLQTKWLDGNLHYSVKIFPYTNKLEQLYNKCSYRSCFTFYFNLKDKDGFELINIPLRVNELTRVIDDAGKPYSLEKSDGKFEVKYQTYANLSDWSVSHSGTSN